MPITHLSLSHLLSSHAPEDFSARRQLSDVSLAIAKAKKIVVVSGAGISCSSGIPDFRSADGLYSLVKARYPSSFVTGKDLFSSQLFLNPSTSAIFYTFISELAAACREASPTRTHHFIDRLNQKGKLLRSYTQNVDGLERRMGIESGGRGNGLKKKSTRNVELHGDLGRVRCVLCYKDFEAREEWMEAFREGEAPDCPACMERCESRVSRSARALPIGTLRPAIVLYDEAHPLGDDIGQLQTYDMARQPDLLLIMGTSLKVHGLKRLVKEFSKVVHSSGKRGLVVFVNQSAPSKEWEGIIDIHIQGETDTWVERVEEEWRRVKPGDWETQTLLDAEMEVVAKAKGKASFKNGPAKNGKGPAHSVAGSNTNPQLPTPRPSTSPRQIPEPPSSPLTPPPPLSPSKRKTNVNSSIGSHLPSKKTKPPSTGLASTPGKGNLFFVPSYTVDDENTWEDEEEVAKIILKIRKPSARASGQGKENVPTPVRTTKAKTKKVVETRAKSARARRTVVA
ncbi:hypothetical protein P7C73_g3393, partial [Tremellales sp. Uapishka_1]